MFDPSKPPSTLAELAQRSFVSFAKRPYLGEKRDGKYEFDSFATIAARVQNVCGALLEAGLVGQGYIVPIRSYSQTWDELGNRVPLDTG